MRLEKRTVDRMIRIYCRAHHHGGAIPCAACSRLRDYALMRIQKCPFGENKPVCNRCTVHCYDQEMRGQIKAVMRYAGPRMLLRHPLLAVYHLIRSRKNARS